MVNRNSLTDIQIIIYNLDFYKLVFNIQMNSQNRKETNPLKP